MGYLIVADRLDMGDLGKHEFGFAPKHPIMDASGTHVISYAPGKRYGVHPETGGPETFEWLGDPEDPPNWCSPADPEAEEAYRRQAERRGDSLKAKLAQKRAELEALEAEVLEAEADAEAGSEKPADPMAKARAAKKAKAVQAAG